MNTSTLSDYELVIASHLVVPEDITVSWSDIAGLESVVQELRENVILPVRHRNLFVSSQLCQAPKGVLLHGPPGKYINIYNTLLGYSLHQFATHVRRFVLHFQAAVKH